MQDAQYWITQLGLHKHPEGGYFKETYRSREILPATGLPARFGGPRHLATAIYYLLEQNDCSRLHRLQADEIWHFYAGSPVLLHQFSPIQGYTLVALGQDPEKNQVQQAVIPASTWFGAHVPAPGAFVLVGCTVAPGFDFKDFELGEQQTLLRKFPGHRAIIERLTASPHTRA